MIVILLTADQVARVSGGDGPLTALVPQPLTDGRFFLDAAVLDDPAHQAARAVLAGLPTSDLSEIASLLPAPPGLL